MGEVKNISSRVGDELSDWFEPAGKKKRCALRRARRRAEIARVRTGITHSGIALVGFGVFVVAAAAVPIPTQIAWRIILVSMGIVTIAVGARHIDYGNRSRRRLLNRKKTQKGFASSVRHADHDTAQ